MELIKDILPQVIDGLSSGKLENQVKINRLWQTLVEPRANRHAQPAGFKKGVLTVNVDSPVWLFQLSFKRQQILAQLQKEFKELSTIKFRIGKVR